MDQQVMSFRMATLAGRGMVVMEEAGLDLMRALILKWIEECERSEDRAKAFGSYPGMTRDHKAEVYYRNARSFLTHLLCRGLKCRVKLSEQLRWVARWREECDLPPGWIELLNLKPNTGDDDGAGDTTASGSGAGGVGGGGPTQVVGGSERQTDPAALDVGPPQADSGSGVITSGPVANKPGESGTSNNRGRGRQRKPKSRTTPTG